MKKSSIMLAFMVVIATYMSSASSMGGGKPASQQAAGASNDAAKCAKYLLEQLTSPKIILESIARQRGNLNYVYKLLFDGVDPEIELKWRFNQDKHRLDNIKVKDLLAASTISPYHVRDSFELWSEEVQRRIKENMSKYLPIVKDPDYQEGETKAKLIELNRELSKEIIYQVITKEPLEPRPKEIQDLFVQYASGKRIPGGDYRTPKEELRSLLQGGTVHNWRLVEIAIDSIVDQPNALPQIMAELRKFAQHTSLSGYAGVADQVTNGKHNLLPDAMDNITEVIVGDEERPRVEVAVKKVMIINAMRNQTAGPNQSGGSVGSSSSTAPVALIPEVATVADESSAAGASGAVETKDASVQTESPEVVEGGAQTEGAIAATQDEPEGAAVGVEDLW